MNSAADLFNDFDFHPDEPYVRQFQLTPHAILRLDDDAFVSETTSNGIILRHYAFADEWFKINVTIDHTGAIVEPALSPPTIPKSFAYNCDIATPMQRAPNAVYSTDLFLDVLVRLDGTTHEVVDQDEFTQAAADNLISPSEAHQALAALTRLTTLITAGNLYEFLHATHPFGPSSAPHMLPVLRAPTSSHPQIQPHERSTW